MPNIASVLKAEIARVARKEIKAETEALKSASTKYRSDIAALKRQVAALQKELKLASGTRNRPDPASQEGTSETRHRFSAKGLVSQRKRLGLSAEALGKLIGVSGLSIYHWEGGKARPRANHLPAIAALKTLGKKEAAAVLASR
jgi:DNA-binding transcriptional regulator YiaG